MLEERSFKVDFAALLLMALSVFLALSVLTFDPADPPSRLVYPANAHVSNLCGPLGAWVAVLLLGGLGIGAYYAVISLAALAGCLLVKHELTEPAIRGVGWVVSLLGITTLAALSAPGLTQGSIVGAGGYLGATLRGLLESHCASAGAHLLAISLIAGGLLLSTDYVLVRIAAWLGGRSTKLAGACLHTLPKALPKKALSTPAVVTDLAQPIVLPGSSAAEATEDDEEYEIPIKRRSSDEDDDEAEASAAATTAETSEADDEEATDESAEPESGVRVRPPRKNERQAVLDELDAASRVDSVMDYELPPMDLLLDGEPFSFEEQEKDVRRKAKILEKTFANFGFKVKVVEVETGPVIAQFEVELEAGLRLSKITSLSEDLAIALRVPSVRIVAPIPGKNTVGIEVPNAERQLVRLREVVEEANGKASKMRIPIYLGKDVSGKPMVVDLTTLPHLLIAGRTGTGKSVCLNTIIMSILMARRPDDVRMLLIDPKMVELSSYMKLPHLMHPVVTDMRKAEAILGWAVEKMEERYALLARAGVRHISVYNQLGEEEIYDRLGVETDEERKEVPTHLPYIVIVADEMADLMMTAAKEVEAHIIRLAQKSRAVGIHLVLATQKPTVDVITGLIKSNLPARISFQVASRTDSRVVLDEMGADKLLGNGDMLFLWPGTSMLLRGQGAYVSDDEITRVVDFAGQHEPQFVNELIQLKPANSEGQTGGKNRHQDDLYDAAVDIVIREGRGSVSLLQRALGIGYGRAARLIDYMAEDGIVGQYNGSQAREVVISLEQWQAMSGQAGEPEPEPPPAAKKRALPAPSTAAAPRSATPPRSRVTRILDIDDEEADEDEDSGDEDDESDDARSVARARRDWAEESDEDESGDFDDADSEDAGESDESEDEAEDEGDDEISDETDDDLAPWEDRSRPDSNGSTRRRA